MDLPQERRDSEEGEEEKEYYRRASDMLSSLGFPINGHFQASPDTASSNYSAAGSPPTPDVKVSVISSSKAQPVLSSSRKEGPVYEMPPGGSRRIRVGSGRYLMLIDPVLRSVAAVASLVAFALMSTTRETRSASGSTFEVKFSDFHAYYYLVAVHVLSFIYSSAQVVISQSSSGNSSKSAHVPSLRSGLCKYFCDAILAFCLLSASSAAATALDLSYNGLRNIWPPACSTWKLWTFCLRAEAVVIISFCSAFSVMLSSLVSGFCLLRIVSSV